MLWWLWSSCHQEIADFLGTDTDLGRRYTRSLLAQVVTHRPWLLPYALAHLAAMWLGYRVGAADGRLPHGIKRKLTGPDCYGDSTHCANER